MLHLLCHMCYITVTFQLCLQYSYNVTIMWAVEHALIWNRNFNLIQLKIFKKNHRLGNGFLRRCETPPYPPAPDPVGIENCKQFFSPLLAPTTQKIATHNTDIISAVCVAFFWVVNASRNEKSCLQFLITTAVFHMLLTNIFSFGGTESPRKTFSTFSGIGSRLNALTYLTIYKPWRYLLEHLLLGK